MKFTQQSTLAILSLASFAIAQGTYATYGAGCPGSSSTGICISSNGSATQVTTRCSGFKNYYALRVPNSAPSITVAGFELLSQQCTNPSILSVAILDSTATGRPGSVLAKGSMTIGATMGWHRFSLAKPLTITTRRAFFLEVIGNQTCRFPVVLTGQTATHFLKTPSGNTYLGPYTNLKWAWRLVCGRPAKAPKLVNTPRTIASANGSAASNTAGTTGHIHTYALPVANSSALRMVGGFELFTQAVQNASSTLKVAIRDSTSTGFPGATLASGTMTVTSTLGWHRFTLKTPLRIATRRRFFIQYQGNTSVRFPLALSGTKSDHYLMKSGTNFFTGPYNKILSWAWRVNGDPGPSLGNTFFVELTSARPKSGALLLFGGQRAKLDLRALGAPGCFLLTSQVGLILPVGATDALGVLKLPLAIPNDRRLINVMFRNQYAVNDPANALTFVFSNGGEGTIR